MFVVDGVAHALQLSFFMLWEVLWPLALGFLLVLLGWKFLADELAGGIPGSRTAAAGAVSGASRWTNRPALLKTTRLG